GRGSAVRTTPHRSCRCRWWRAACQSGPHRCAPRPPAGIGTDASRARRTSLPRWEVRAGPRAVTVPEQPAPLRPVRGPRALLAHALHAIESRRSIQAADRDGGRSQLIRDQKKETPPAGGVSTQRVLLDVEDLHGLAKHLHRFRVLAGLVQGFALGTVLLDIGHL